MMIKVQGVHSYTGNIHLNRDNNVLSMYMCCTLDVLKWFNTICLHAKRMMRSAQLSC